MRYRLEMIEGMPTVRNVETDVALGWIVGWGDQYRQVNFESVLNWEGEENTVSRPLPLKRAIATIAFNEAYKGYPGLKNCEPKPDPVRIEFALGNLLADATSTLARAMIEYQGGGLRKETKEKFVDLMSKVFDIRWASAFGSLNGETRQDELYFFNVWSKNRGTFDDAAQAYGMHELRHRFLDAPEVVLQELLSCVLQLLKQASDPEMPDSSSLH